MSHVPLIATVRCRFSGKLTHPAGAFRRWRRPVHGEVVTYTARSRAYVTSGRTKLSTASVTASKTAFVHKAPARHHQDEGVSSRASPNRT